MTRSLFTSESHATAFIKWPLERWVQRVNPDFQCSLGTTCLAPFKSSDFFEFHAGGTFNSMAFLTGSTYLTQVQPRASDLTIGCPKHVWSRYFSNSCQWNSWCAKWWIMAVAAKGHLHWPRSLCSCLKSWQGFSRSFFARRESARFQCALAS